MNRFIEPVTYSGSNDSSVGAWIFLIIFFGIIAALIIVAVIGSKKDKIEKLIENDKRKKIRTKATADRIALFSYLHELTMGIKKEVENFQPSIGTKSLGDINREANARMKDLADSKALKGIYLSEDFKVEIKPIVDELVKVKPSNWAKEASFAINLVEAKYKAIEHTKENDADIARGKDLLNLWHHDEPKKETKPATEKEAAK